MQRSRDEANPVQKEVALLNMGEFMEENVADLGWGKFVGRKIHGQNQARGE